MNAKNIILVYPLVAVMMMLQVLTVSAQDEMLSLTSQQKNVSEIAISNYQTIKLPN
jgi:hypothetical protein